MSWNRTIKSLLCVLLLLSAELLTSCCDEPYAFHWLAIMSDNADKGMTSTLDTLPSADYCVHVRMLNKKEHLTSWQFFSSARAVDCFPRYELLDSITDIKVIRLNSDQSTQDLSLHFTGNFYYTPNASDNAYPLADLANQLNRDFYGFDQNIVFCPEVSYTLSGTMRIIIRFELSDLRVLSDTTKSITLIP